MTIDHLGIIVSSLEDGIQQWRTLFGYKQASEVVVNTRQQVKVVFLAKPGSLTVKLVEPSCTASPVAGFAQRGGGLHHICFKCDSIPVEMPILESKGARFIVKPQPGEAFNNHDIALFVTRNNLVVELIDSTEKAGWEQANVQGIDCSLNK